MSRLVVVGGSDQGRQLIDALRAGGVHEIAGVVDRALAAGSDVVGVPVVGSDDALAEAARATGADGYVVAIGDNAVRAAVSARAAVEAPGLRLVTVVHPGATIADDARVGPGAIVLAGAVVANGCDVGAGALLGVHASLDHDGHLGGHASLGPGATTGGRVHIGDRTAIGLGASVIHGVEIGADTVVGAGAVVLADLPDCVVAFGVPARVVRPRTPGEPYLSQRA